MNINDEFPNDLTVAVWDTYVMKKDGSVMHFDIMVPEDFNDQKTIFKYGEDYAKSKGENYPVIDTTKCQFCHVEQVTSEARDGIADNGHYILEMDDIPKNLPEHPSKRDLALFIKGHFKEFRFSNFSGVSTEILQKIVASKMSHSQ